MAEQQASPARSQKAARPDYLRKQLLPSHDAYTGGLVMIRASIITFTLAFLALAWTPTQKPPSLDTASAPEPRACTQGPKRWDDVLDVDDDLREEEVEVFETGFHARFLARWSPEQDVTGKSPVWAVATRLIVRFSIDVGPQQARNILSSFLSAPTIEVRKLPLPNTFLVEEDWDPDSQPSRHPLLTRSRSLKNKPQIERYSPDFLYFSLSEPIDDLFQQRQDDLKRIGAVAAWDISRGEGISVAVLDTGVDLGHSDLDNNIKPGLNVIHPTDPPRDDNDHGTFCAGIIGAEADGYGVVGVAPQASIIPIKVLDQYGCGTSSDVIKGIHFALDKADVISASFGGFPESRDLRDKIAEAGRKGILLVAGAGNATRNLDNPRQRFFPAGFDLDNIISVGATTDGDKPRMDWGHGKIRVHLSAPGETVHSTCRSSYCNQEGTSAATAFVSGACALVKASMKASGMTPTVKDIKNRILQASTDPRQALVHTGASCSEGRLDLANAVRPGLLRQVCL